MTRLKPKLLVLGGGPGGYVAAIRAGQLGLDTVLVEADRLGGTCLNIGCIPSKALIHAATRFAQMSDEAGLADIGIGLASAPSLDLAQTMRWKDGVVERLNRGIAGLLKRAKVNVVKGWGVFSDAKTCTVTTADGPVVIMPEHVILATGSAPIALPALPFGDRVISSTEALSLQELPATLAVIGGGYIGLELGIAFRKLGSAVTIVEAQDRLLPLYDAELVAPVARWLEAHGVCVHLGARATGHTADGLQIMTMDGRSQTIAADRILVTVGRRARLEGWGLETMGVDLTDGFVKIDDRCATSMRGVWAIGDLVGEPMLEHKAAAQGHMVAEIIAGHSRRFDPVAIAAVCFTEPEIVSVGLSPGQAAAQAVETVVTSFPFTANGRALSTGSGEGFVRVVARRDNRRILGIQAVGGHVAELSGEFALALEMGAVLEDIAGTIHAHPTLGEAFFESTLRALDQAIQT